MKFKYLLEENKDSYKTLINQTGVKHYLLPSPSIHNAIWDGYLTKKGEIYFSLCSELTTSEYAKLAKLNIENEQIEELFYLKETYFNSERYIRDSKIHTAISEMEDGNLIMVSHTTDKAPEHPAWMPNAYYGNQWTGYSGSHLMIFDPEKNEVKYMGIPVPRESLYGAVYSTVTKSYYALGFIKGHLYKINPKTMEVKDYGQVVERASYRLVIGKDNNIYFSTRSGSLMKLDIQEDRVINLDIMLPKDEDPYKKRGYISYAANGPDGRIYISTQFTDILSAFDPKTNELEIIGKYKEADYFTDSSPGWDHLAAFGFDKFGVLYGAICYIRENGHEDYKVPTTLVRWDILNGGKPEHLGVLGSVDKAIVTTANMLMDHENDKMFIFGTNHGNDGGDILQVDLSLYRNEASILGPKCLHPYIIKGNGKYDVHNESIVTTLKYWKENPFYCMVENVKPIALWKDFGLDPQYRIDGIKIENDLINVHLNDKTYVFDFQGTFLEVNSSEYYNDSNKEYNKYIPYNYPGRQFNQKVEFEINFDTGETIQVSKDGILVAILEDGKIRNYGPVWSQSPLISWVKLNNSDEIYGLAGDKDDLSVVFRFTIDSGIEWLGFLGVDTVEKGVFSSPFGKSIAISGDDKNIVIASGTTLPTLYIYNLEGNNNV